MPHRPRLDGPCPAPLQPAAAPPVAVEAARPVRNAMAPAPGQADRRAAAFAPRGGGRCPHPGWRSLALGVGLAAAGVLSGCGALPAPSEAQVQRLVAEDDQVRIDELRVRGETQRLTVRPKHGGRAYDITPPRNPADTGAAAGGQRVWPVLSF